MLKETNNSVYFQDYFLILYELWGWIPPNIDNILPIIENNYIRTREAYKKINPTSSSMNVYLRLYWELRMAGHECCLEDFKIPQSTESRKKNSHDMQLICKELNLTFYPII